MASSSHEHELKVVFLGDTFVGKTSIIQRFINSEFVENREPSISAVFTSKVFTFGHHQVTFRVWDTAGQERFHSLGKTYYAGAGIVFIVFDVTRPDSFASTKQWLTEIGENCADRPIIMIVGNKIDLGISPELDLEATTWAETEQISYAKVSAKTEDGICEMFLTAAKTFCESKNIAIKSMTLRPVHPEGKRCC